MATCRWSEARILDRAIGNDAGWETIPLAPGEGLVINTQAWEMRRVLARNAANPGNNGRKKN